MEMQKNDTTVAVHGYSVFCKRIAKTVLALLLAAMAFFSGCQTSEQAPETSETIVESASTVAATVAAAVDTTAMQTESYEATVFASIEDSIESTLPSATEAKPAQAMHTSAEVTVLPETLTLWQLPEQGKSGEELAVYSEGDVVSVYPGTRYTDENCKIWMQAEGTEGQTGWAHVGKEYVELKAENPLLETNAEVCENGLPICSEVGGNWRDNISLDAGSHLLIEEDSKVESDKGSCIEVWMKAAYGDTSGWVCTSETYIRTESGDSLDSFAPEANAVISAEDGAALYEDPTDLEPIGSCEKGKAVCVQRTVTIKTIRIGEIGGTDLWAQLSDGYYIKMEAVNMAVQQEEPSQEPSQEDEAKTPNAKVTAKTLRRRIEPSITAELDAEKPQYTKGETLWVDWNQPQLEEADGDERTWLQTNDGFWVCWKEQKAGESEEKTYLEEYIPGSEETEPPMESTEATAMADLSASEAETISSLESTSDRWRIAFYLCLALLAAAVIGVIWMAAAIGRYKGKIEETRSVPPTPPQGRPNVGVLYNQGKRDSQQDSWCIAPVFDGNGFLAAVADGMGGLSDGDKVSKRIIEDVKNLACGAEPQNLDKDLPSMVNYISRDINHMLGPDGIYKSGSTLLLVLTDGKRFSWAAVGDSRIYLYRAGVLNHVNQEHNVLTTELMPKVYEGQLSYQDAINNPDGKKVTSFIGMGDLRYVSYSQSSSEIMPGDRILLMSDGVFNTLSDQEMEEILSQYPDAKQAAKAIEERVLAINAKWQDNFTAVILGF